MSGREDFVMMRPAEVARDERGTTLAELMIALVVLAVGLLAVAQLFPSASRGQVQDRMLTTANYYAQEKVEDLVNLTWTDTRLTVARHPAGTATEDLGQWQRFYTVTQLAAPLDNLKKVTVTVTWNFQGNRSVNATTYIRR